MAPNSLKNLTRRSVGLKTAFSAMDSAVFSEDDRSAAITSGALVEVALEKAIKHRLRVLTKDEIDKIFRGTGPLSTFSAKIQIGYALGIYGKDTKHDLQTILDIRNSFAHSVHNLTFKNKKFKIEFMGCTTSSTTSRVAHLTQRVIFWRQPAFCGYNSRYYLDRAKKFRCFLPSKLKPN